MRHCPVCRYKVRLANRGQRDGLGRHRKFSVPRSVFSQQL
jgi:hypothetical protein